MYLIKRSREGVVAKTYVVHVSSVLINYGNIYISKGRCWEKSIVLRMHESVQRTYVTPKRKNKNLTDSPRLYVSADPQELNSLLLDNLVDNGSI
jgi:hypothetical protein